MVGTAPEQGGAPETASRGSTSGALEHSLMWRVDGPSGPVFLFGTIHAGITGSWRDMPEDVLRAFAASDVVVLEADLNPAKLGGTGIRSTMVYPDDESLRAKLGKIPFETLSAELEQPDSVLDRLRPWVAYSQLSRQYLPEGQAVDSLVRQRGEATGKEFRYLETAIEQAEMMARLVTVGMLRDALTRLDEMRQQQNKLLDAYRTGDADKLRRFAFSPALRETYPDILEALFDDRNAAWVSDVEGYIEQGNVFVAVGAGHLVGEDSVVDLLRERGYDVTRTTTQ